jgi:tetratricopeptide (TPR) repeat protein
MRSVVLAIVIFGVSAAPIASAQPQDVEAAAREAFARGKRHYDLAEYDQAIAAWKEAYHLKRSPLLLFNIGQAFRLSGDCAQATQFYASYRREERAPKNLAELEAAEALCAAALARPSEPRPGEPRPGEPRPSEPRPTEPKPSEPRPTEPRPIEPSPGPATTGPTSAATTPGAALPRPAPVRGGDPGRGRRLAGLVAGGAGLALIGTGVVFELRARDARSTIEGASGEWTLALASLEDRGRRDRTIALVAFGAGAGALATGAILYVLGRRDDAVEITPTAGGATVAWRARF